MTNKASSASQRVKSSWASRAEGGPYLRGPDFGRVDRSMGAGAQGQTERGLGVNSESPQQQTWVKNPTHVSEQSSKHCSPRPKALLLLQSACKHVFEMLFAHRK